MLYAPIRKALCIWCQQKLYVKSEIVSTNIILADVYRSLWNIMLEEKKVKVKFIPQPQWKTQFSSWGWKW